MTESGFEARLARSLREMADYGLRPFDARAVAEAVVATRRGSLGSARWLMTREGPRLIWLAVAALLLLAALAWLAFVGSRMPTSERLAFIRNGDIWVAYADGRDARLLIAHDAKAVDTGGCTGVRWSPDGSRLAALDLNGGSPGKRRIVVITSDGTSRGSFDVESGPIEMAWSPDGNHLAVLAPQATGGRLWLLDRDGKLDRELALPPQYRAAKAVFFNSVSWSPDGGSLAITGCPCSSENNGSWILAVDGSGARQIQFPGQGSAMSLAWSPDGKQVAIGSGQWTEPSRAIEGPGELWVMNVDRGSAQRVATRVELLIVTEWSPDGTWIAFSEPNSLDVVRADGSGEPLRLGPASDVMQWSEDRRLFYLAAPSVRLDSPSDWHGIGSIMVVDPAGGKPAVVIDGVDAHAPFDIARPPVGGSSPQR
jgi:Tol biopolymer transport system component